ncbi:Uncharacterised protein [Mycobacteroides abscessus subsp. abscessus]|nr:Uncharacterised protein [Mycobacteroides abscessus subsp. abscessus]
MAKSRAGGIAMYTSIPAGTITAARPARRGAYSRAVPRMARATPTRLRTSDKVSATYSRRMPPPAQPPR